VIREEDRVNDVKGMKEESRGKTSFERFICENTVIALFIK